MNTAKLEGSTMARSTAAASDPISHMPELLFHVSTCWRAIRDARTEVDPFGRSFDALGEARASLEAFASHCTGQRGLLVLIDVREPPGGGPGPDRGGTPS